MVEWTDEMNDQLRSDAVNRVVFREVGSTECYMVGGFVRDILMQRCETDRDYVVRGEAGRTAERLAGIMGGSHIRLGRFGLGRVILPDGITLDFSPLRSDLRNDMMSRDFGINGLAWAPDTGLIDLVGGMDDIQCRRVRAIGGDSITSDPLRIIRAFRFGQELGFSIDAETRRMISVHAGLLECVAGERITSEFIRIINAHEPSHALESMCELKVLERLIYFNNSELRLKLKAISTFQQMVNVLPVKYHFMLWEPVSQGLMRIGMVRLAALLGSGVKHRLVLGSALMRRIAGSVSATRVYTPDIALDRLFDLFSESGDAAPDFLLWRGRPDLLEHLERFRRIHRNPLLDGDDMLRITGLEPGPVVGRVRRALNRLEFLGRIRNREEAVEACLGVAYKWYLT